MQLGSFSPQQISSAGRKAKVPATLGFLTNLNRLQPFCSRVASERRMSWLNSVGWLWGRWTHFLTCCALNNLWACLTSTYIYNNSQVTKPCCCTWVTWNAETYLAANNLFKEPHLPSPNLSIKQSLVLLLLVFLCHYFLEHQQGLLLWGTCLRTAASFDTLQ